jgi:hypothetical protein
MSEKISESNDKNLKNGKLYFNYNSCHPECSRGIPHFIRDGTSAVFVIYVVLSFF